MGKPTPNLTGNRYGRLVVTSATVKDKYANVLFVCQCDCGGTINAQHCNLRNGKTVSCGCKRRSGESNLRHGAARVGKMAGEYKVWCGIKRRCLNQNEKDYPLYGGRGIKICDEWLDDFQAFISFVGPRPTASHQIDRIDSNGNYEPGNVRWATPQEQARNRRNNKIVEYQGRSMCLSEASALAGLKHSTVVSRLSRGATIEEALQPQNKHHRKVIKIHGEEIPLSEAVKKYGGSYQKIHYRINDLGWSVEKAFELP